MKGFTEYIGRKVGCVIGLRTQEHTENKGEKEKLVKRQKSG